jgi:uncharacterized membrane protein
VEVVTPLLIGIIFTIVGNYLPKCRQNYTIGFKIPWTLHSEENWNKTHRLGGIVWTIGGVLTIISTFIGFTALLLPIMLAMVFVPMIYSYLLYRKGI